METLSGISLGSSCFIIENAEKGTKLRIVKHEYSHHYSPTVKTIDRRIDEKLNILEDFRAIDEKNREYARSIFVEALRNYVNSDPDAVLDRVAKSIIVNGLT